MDAQRELSPRVSFADSNKMPYLLAVCKEAMRLNPSVGLGLPRYVPQGGREICGRYFPEGVSIDSNRTRIISAETIPDSCSHQRLGSPPR